MKKKEIVQLSITGVFAVILILLLFSGRKGDRLKFSEAELRQNAKSSGKLAARDARGLFVRLEDETRDLEVEKDPFHIKAEEVETVVEINLEGIAWDKEHPRAIINGEIVEKGQVINGNTVVDIQEYKVILNDGSSDLELKIYKED